MLHMTSESCSNGIEFEVEEKPKVYISLETVDTMVQRLKPASHSLSYWSRGDGRPEWMQYETRIGKARAAFNQLKNIWRSREISTTTPNPNTTKIIVKSILPYGAETWRTTVTTLNKILVFIITSLMKILMIRWPDKISNEELWQRRKQQPIEVDILQRR
ncbi:hypothetical protein BgiMline_032202 [Biomphalaria glabrata]|nr:hypothetical protein BgiMline_028755 [Biomphalaria glabrata]